MRGARKIGTVVVAASLLFVVGCGDDDGDSTTVKTPDGDVKIDRDGEGFTIETDSGDMTVSGDGEDMTFEGDDGNVSIGGGADLPDDWPADLAPPDAVTILGTTEIDGSMTVVGEADASAEELAEGLKTQLEDAGYTIDGDNTFAANGVETRTMSGTGTDYTVQAAISEEASMNGKTSVTVTLTPVE